MAQLFWKMVENHPDPEELEQRFQALLEQMPSFGRVINEKWDEYGEDFLPRLLRARLR